MFTWILVYFLNQQKQWPQYIDACSDSKVFKASFLFKLCTFLCMDKLYLGYLKHIIIINVVVSIICLSHILLPYCTIFVITIVVNNRVTPSLATLVAILVYKVRNGVIYYDWVVLRRF